MGGKVIMKANIHQLQQGSASIEFALSFVLILVLILGMSTLSIYIWAQQKLSYAAGEGSRIFNAWHQSTSHDQPCNLIASQAQPSVCSQVKNSLGFLQDDVICSLQQDSCTQIENTLLADWQVCSFDTTLSYNTQNNALLHLLTQAHYALSDSNLAISQLHATSSINIMCLKESPL